MITEITAFIQDIQGYLKDDSSGIPKELAAKIDNILKLVSMLISDGIQPSDVHKLIVLLGKVVAMVPSLNESVSEIMKSLKDLFKEMMDQDPFGLGAQPEKMQANILKTIENMEAINLEVGIKGSLMDEIITDTTTSIDSGLDDSDMNPIDFSTDFLTKTQETREDLAMKILEDLNDGVILNQTNFEELQKMINRLYTRSSIDDSNNNATSAP